MAEADIADITVNLNIKLNISLKEQYSENRITVPYLNINSIYIYHSIRIEDCL